MASRYGWETTGQRGWEALEDGAKGLRMSTTQLLKQKHEARDARAAMSGPLSNVRRGIIRHLVLCFDMSQANNRAIDYRPSRLEVMHAAIAKFLAEFFDINPLSHLMMVVTKNGSARIVKMGLLAVCSSKSTQGRGSGGSDRPSIHSACTRTCSYAFERDARVRDPRNFVHCIVAMHC